MSFVVRGLLGVASVVCPTLAQAQTAPSAPPTAPAPPPTTAPAATAPAATAPAATAAAPVRVYMRNEGSPLTFSAHAESAAGAASAPSWCISPCDVRLSPGDYRLKLNGRAVDGTLALRQPGTLHGEYQSRAGARSAAWLALNLGGIIGGVFLTVGVAGSSRNAFIIGGGVLASSVALFVITYRADRASVSFTPDPPPDVRGMPDPATLSGSRHASLDRPSPGAAPPGLGFRIAF